MSVDAGIIGAERHLEALQWLFKMNCLHEFSSRKQLDFLSDN
jgi:hypothetical protein